MQFKIMSRTKARRFTYAPECCFDCIIISITDPGSDPNRFCSYNSCIKGILRLEFDDVDSPEPLCITEKDADLILDFVEKYKDVADLVIVHCEAGISRSAGVAAALMKIYNHDDWEVFDNPRYCPNMTCYRTVLMQYYERMARESEGL